MKFNSDEQHSSQIPALQFFIQMGYEYLPPSKALQERDNKTSNVILENILIKQLKEINRINYKGKPYLFSEENIQSGLEKTKNIPHNNLLSNNQEIYDLITLGTSLKETIDGNSKSYTLNYIDWKNWENNQFHVTAEYTIERTSLNENIRPDIVLFVNGIPWVVLETQLKETFANCGLEPQKAKSGRHLIDLVEEKKASIITTIINKFASAVNIRNFQDTSDNIFILVDESHRSQHGQSFHPKMRQVFPNGCYLGFTGTPLMQTEKNTFSKFGGLIAGTEYTIDQAVEDGAVVPLVYEGRYTETEVNNRPLDTWFERYCQGLNDEQKADLKKKYSRISKLNRAE